MPDINVTIERWPVEGVFATHLQMAQALSDLNDHGWRGTLTVGDDVTITKAWNLQVARGTTEVGVTATMGQVLVYYLDVLRSLNAEQYTELMGEAP